MTSQIRHLKRSASVAKVHHQDENLLHIVNKNQLGTSDQPPAKKQTLATNRREPLRLISTNNVGNFTKSGQGNDVAAALKAIKARQAAASRVRLTRQKQRQQLPLQDQQVHESPQASTWASATNRESSLGSSSQSTSAVKSCIPRSSAEARALKASKRQSTCSSTSSVTSNKSKSVIVNHYRQDVVTLPKTITSLGMDLDYDDAIWMKGSAARIEEVERDPMLGGEYVFDICSYLRDVEGRTLPSPRYMERQPCVTWSMRAILVDWLIQIHYHLRLLPETLYLTISLVDRFLSYKAVSIAKFQLVGVAAMLIACKYEEIVVPCIADFMYMVEGGYTREEIIQAERYLLGMLKYDISSPGPMTFLRRISKADSYDVHTRTLSKYLIESTLTDERFIGVPYSLITAGAMYLSMKVLTTDGWSAMHQHTSGYQEDAVVPIAHSLLDCASQHTKHLFVYSKYSEPRYMNASGFMHEYCRRIEYVPLTLQT